MIKANPSGVYPQIHSSSYMHETAIIIGNVKIGENVFIGPGAVIRADERNSKIIIGDNCNVQDRVIIHCLEETTVIIHQETSLAHGCIIHGPTEIGQNCFIGFASVVFDVSLGSRVVVKHQCCIEKVVIPSNKLIESGQCLRNATDVGRLENLSQCDKDFMDKVLKANLELVSGYKQE